MQLKTVLAISCTLVSFCFCRPVFAADLEDGIAAYNAKDYVKARPLLEKAVAQTPKSWQAHYYLGHTYVVLGQTSRAKYEYETCKFHCTDPTILAQCKAAIDRMDKGIAKAGQSEADAPDAEKPLSDSERVAKDRQAAIMKLATEDCERIKRETQEQLQTEATYSGRRWRNYQTGERKFDISNARKAEIQRECDERCRKVMEDAKRKCNTYH